jgi:hypothetical protein
MFKPYLEESKRKGLHTQYIQADVRNIEFKEGSFDAVMALELLEHLTKEEGYKLIQNMVRWSKKKVIISTPNGYLAHGCRNGNPLQIHKCGWETDELKSLGFRVYGVGGQRALRDHEGRMKFKPEFFWQAVSGFTSVILHNRPYLSFDLFCVKAIERESGGVR